MTTRQINQWCLTAIVLVTSFASSVAQADVVKWRNSIDAAKVEAAQSGRLVLVHFWTPSCGPCKRLDASVFSQPQIAELLERNFVPVKVNADLSPALANAFNITRVPTDIVLTTQGNVIAPLSCPMKPAEYATQLMNLLQHYRQTTAQNSTTRQPPMQAAYTGLKVGEYRNNNGTAATIANANTQPAQQSQPVAPPVASAPQSMNNRYVAAQQAPPAVATQPPVNDRYTAAATQPTLGQQSAVAQPPVTQQPPLTNNVAVQPAAPAVAAQGIQQPAPSAAPAIVTNNHLATNPVAQTAVSPSAPSPQTTKPQLPAGSSPLGFEGYCPVTLKQMRKWVLGDTNFGVTHRGRTYLFTNDQQRQQFLANPDAFSPVFSGMDAVKLLEENQVVEGSRKFGYEYRGAFYLFSSKATMDRFASRPDFYAAGVRQAMTRMDATTGGTIRR